MGLKKIIHVFPKAESEANKAFQRPHGTVGVLICMTSKLLHCKDWPEEAETRLNQSILSQNSCYRVASWLHEPIRSSRAQHIASTSKGGNGACAKFSVSRAEGTTQRRHKGSFQECMTKVARYFPQESKVMQEATSQTTEVAHKQSRTMDQKTMYL